MKIPKYLTTEASTKKWVEKFRRKHKDEPHILFYDSSTFGLSCCLIDDDIELDNDAVSIRKVSDLYTKRAPLKGINKRLRSAVRSKKKTTKKKGRK